MKIEILLYLGVLICLGAGYTGKKSAAEEPELTCSNPLPVQFGDPYVLLTSDGRYYMYGTNAGAVDGFCAYSSNDLIHWKSGEQAYRDNTPDSWAIANFWVPKVYEHDGKLYMFSNAGRRKNSINEEENFRIGVAVSDRSTGPFKELADTPSFDPGYLVIDGNLIEDEDGRVYLYYSHCCCKHLVEGEIADEAKEKDVFDSVEEGRIYGVGVAPDLTHVIGEPILLLHPPVKLNDTQSKWESHSVTKGEVGRRWTESSLMLRHNDLYYMMYSVNYFGGANYAVGYAVSEHPLGPLGKAPNNPVLEGNMEENDIIASTEHNSVIWSRDGKQMYCVYHGHTQKTGGEWVVFIDKMRINKSGPLVVKGPVIDPQSIQ